MPRNGGCEEGGLIWGLGRVLSEIEEMLAGRAQMTFQKMWTSVGFLLGLWRHRSFIGYWRGGGGLTATVRHVVFGFCIL